MSPPAQMVFSKTIPPVSGRLTSSASIIHTPASIQSGFSSMLAGFPFSEASSATLGVVRQNHQSGAYSSAFGSTAPKPFAFGGLVTPMDTVGSLTSLWLLHKEACLVQDKVRPPSTLAPFVQCWNQSVQGLPSQITPLASIIARRTTSGVPSLVPFAQSTPLPGGIKAGSGLDFGMSSPTVQGSGGKDSIRSRTPSFCIGTKSKTPRNWEPGRSRRHPTYKK